jgi:hypothetical protein
MGRLGDKAFEHLLDALLGQFTSLVPFLIQFGQELPDFVARDTGLLQAQTPKRFLDGSLIVQILGHSSNSDRYSSGILDDRYHNTVDPMM